MSLQVTQWTADESNGTKKKVCVTCASRQEVDVRRESPAIYSAIIEVSFDKL